MRKRTLGFGSGRGGRSLRIEQLELRSMLAGNVNLSVSGGNLFITGDANDNAIQVEQVGPHSYEVIGFDFANGSLAGERQGGATTISGAGTSVASDPGTIARVVTGIKGGIFIDLKGGHDTTAVGNSLGDLNALTANNDEEENDGGFGFGLGLAIGSGDGDTGETSTAAVKAQQPILINFNVPGSLFINAGNGG